MSLDRHKLFNNLLNQIQLQNRVNSESFKTGVIDTVEIHMKSKRWLFKIGLETILPYQDFLTFYDHLKAAFPPSVKVILMIKVDHPKMTEKLLRSYWQWVVSHSGVPVSLLQPMINNFPKLKDSQIIYLADNKNIEKQIPKVEHLYWCLGFSNFHIDVKYKKNPRSSNSRSKINPPISEKNKADIQLAQQAADLIQNKR